MVAKSRHWPIVYKIACGCTAGNCTKFWTDVNSSLSSLRLYSEQQSTCRSQHPITTILDLGLFLDSQKWESLKNFRTAVGDWGPSPGTVSYIQGSRILYSRNQGYIPQMVAVSHTYTHPHPLRFHFQITRPHIYSLLEIPIE